MISLLTTIYTTLVQDGQTALDVAKTEIIRELLRNAPRLAIRARAASLVAAAEQQKIAAAAAAAAKVSFYVTQLLTVVFSLDSV